MLGLPVANAQSQKNTYSGAPNILVGLMKSDSVRLRVYEDYEMISKQDKYLLPDQSYISLEASGNKVRFTISDGAKVLHNETSDPILITPFDQNDSASFSISTKNTTTSNLSGSRFRGSILIIPNEHSLDIANILDIEKYLWSVASCEMPGNWEKEALNAQTIASRTYTLHKNALLNDPVDIASITPNDIKIWADESNQVYRGIDSENENVIKACTETTGEVLTYNGTPIAAYYHADGGGMTETPQFVWGGAIPYLSSVKELEHESPHYNWENTFSAKTLDTKLATLLQEPNIDMIFGNEAGTSGRWFTVNIKSYANSTVVKANDLRLSLGLKSTWFSIFRKGDGRETLGHLNPAYETFVSNGSEMHSTSLEHCKIHNSQGLFAPITGATVVSVEQDGPVEFVFKGNGAGHGVGLSQWGAKFMAAIGYDFTDILKHYYPGTSIEIWW